MSIKWSTFQSENIFFEFITRACTEVTVAFLEVISLCSYNFWIRFLFVPAAYLFFKRLLQLYLTVSLNRDLFYNSGFFCCQKNDL